MIRTKWSKMYVQKVSGWIVLGSPKNRESDLDTDEHALNNDLIHVGDVEIGIDQNKLVMIGIR